MASTPSSRNDERDRRGHLRPWFYAIVKNGSKPIFLGIFRLRVRGTEHVPTTGGFVVSSQHRSNWDAFLIGLPIDRHLRFMAKAEMYRFAPMAWIVRSGGAFKVERGKSDTAAVEMAIELAREGWGIAIYPEGTRNKRGKEPPRPRSGAARIALTAGVPMIPVAINGVKAFRLFPPRIPRFEAIIGAPLPVDDLVGIEDVHEAAHVLTERWVAAVEALADGFAERR
jgi:1-acyl-sn-glycerol-3-phosphate acyltransferase